MKKLLLLLSLLLLSVLSCSCDDGTIVFPFEADIEKHMTAALCNSEKGSFIVTDENTVILENENFSVSLISDAIVFTDRQNGISYDTFGNEVTDYSNVVLNISFVSESGNVISYKSGTYFDPVYGIDRNTCTAFYLDGDTVRIIYVTGIDELRFIGEIPSVITKETANKNVEFLKYYDLSSVSDSSPEAEFVSRFCTEESFYVKNDTDIPEAEIMNLGLCANMTRTELLSLGYSVYSAHTAMTVVDITLNVSGITLDTSGITPNENGIVFDISKNRQYKGEALRTSEFTERIFDFELPFVEITHSESDKVTFAGSKY